MIEEINQNPQNKPAKKAWWQSRWARWLLVWGIWTFIGLVFTLQGYFTSYRSERPVPFVDSLYMQMIWAYLFALATPLVLWAVTRMPIERNNWVRNALLHIPISIVLAVLLTALGLCPHLATLGLAEGQATDFRKNDQICDSQLQ